MQSYNHHLDDDSVSYEQCSYQTNSYRDHENNINNYKRDTSFFNQQPATTHQQSSFHQPHAFQRQSQQPSEYQFLIYQNKIQILNDRLQCYIEEVENLKKTNSILLNKLSTIELLDQELEQQKNKNFQLRQQIETYRDQIEDDKITFENHIEELKHQIEQKDIFIDLMTQQHQKNNNKKDQQINYLNTTLKQKINKLQTYQKKLHNLQIERLNTQEDSHNDRDSFLMKNSQISRIRTQNSQNLNTMNLQKSTVSVQQKAKMFMKRDPSQLKIMVKSLTHAQKCLQIGGQQLSMIGYERQQQKSMLNASRLTTKSKINKTYYK